MRNGLNLQLFHERDTRKKIISQKTLVKSRGSETNAFTTPPSEDPDVTGVEGGANKRIKTHVCAQVCQKASNLPCFSLNSSRLLPTEYLTSCIITMSLPTPYSQNFLKPLQANRRIGIDAVFKDDGDKFTVMLLCDGDEDMADALLIMDIDGSPEIKINFRKDGVRGEPSIVQRCDCIKGKKLQLFIEMEASHFKIALNEKDLVKLPYKFPLKMVKYIYIDGDIDLNKVALPDDVIQG